MIEYHLKPPVFYIEGKTLPEYKQYVPGREPQVGSSHS